jgi:carboxypeptidase Taq
MSEATARFRDLLGEYFDLQASAALLSWDQNTYMPPGGAAARSLQLSTLSQLAHQRFTSEAFGEALEAAEAATADQPPDSDDFCIARRMRREYDKQRRVPTDWVGEHSRVTTMAFQVWQDARKRSDFSSFQPHLARIIELKKEYSAFFAPYDHIYDPLLDDYEPGMKTAEVEAVFASLRPKQTELIRAITERGRQVDDSILHVEYEEEKQWAFGLSVIKDFGFDMQRGREDKSAHPFTTGFGIGDVRITSRVQPAYFNDCFFSTLHEGGHAMYAQGVSPTLDRTPLIDGASLAIHESQSRMWENIVGRSLPFWRHYYPRLRATFPAQLADVALEDFHRAVNKVQPSFIRTEADEATYNLHVMLRFELELALMQGDLSVDELPGIWNEKMHEYLGITPPNDAQGVLQDVHWSSGLVGYFSTYALGNLIACQLWEKIRQDIPDIDAQIEHGSFGDLLGWLRRTIHQHGAKFDPMDLLNRAVGTGLDPAPYMRYLQGKYSAIYGI